MTDHITDAGRAGALRLPEVGGAGALRLPDAETCYRAYETRDARFDGRFFVAVRSTGIFCRPVCPARTPKRANVEFHASAAAAFDAGFRPCLRCRPERAPRAGTQGDAGAFLVERAVAAIEAGALDAEGLEPLAARIGVTSRHLRRLFMAHLGATPAAVAQARRLMFARQLIDETDLPMTRVAFAAGFASIRRFNAAMAGAYRVAPRDLRAAARAGATRGAAHGAVRLRLAPMQGDEFETLLGFYRARAFAGVESVGDSIYKRNVRLGDAAGWFALGLEDGTLMLEATLADMARMPALVARVRRMLDVAAPRAAITAHLSRDARLRPALRSLSPRVPCAWDPFELAVRAVLGQQVSVAAATTLAGRLTRGFGDAVEAAQGEPDRQFPTASRLAGLAPEKLAALGIVRSRAATIVGLARHVEASSGWRERYGGLEAFVEELVRLPGIGPWTANYIAMRGFGEPDAFPAADLGLLRAARALGIADTPRVLERHAETWRPWRSYAAQALWNFNPKDAA